VIAVPSSAACLFDETVAKESAGADCVTTNGVLDHIADDDLKRLLSTIELPRARAGTLFVLEPCYRPGQAAIAKWPPDNDRGEYIFDDKDIAPQCPMRSR
jgi:hypothetical protein